MNLTILRLSAIAGLAATAHGASVNFNTFVSSASISAAEGQNNVIGYTYAGDKFVGSVHIGTNHLQLYSTDLTGGNVQLFGNPLPLGSGEVVVAGSLGQAGFAQGSVYAGTVDNSGNGIIYQYSPTGGTPTVFATGLTGGIRGMLFDPGTSFGSDLIVTTTAGNIYKINSSGSSTLVASTGEDTEGMDIIPLSASGWGSLAGNLVTASEGSGALRFINPIGQVTLASLIPGNIPSFESVNFVPMDIGQSGNPLEGYYVANYANDIQKADASQFFGLEGTLIATSEDGVNARVWDIVLSGAGLTYTQVGNLPNQAEDGIMLSAQRIADAGVPEPGTVMLLGAGLVALGLARRTMR